MYFETEGVIERMCVSLRERYNLRKENERKRKKMIYAQLTMDLDLLL
jgi:hypothetical protein